MNQLQVKGGGQIVPLDERDDFALIEQVVLQGDLSKLNPMQRVTYYNKVCSSAGLNPFTRPFDYITLNGKLTLYAKKDATEQLRKLNGISINKLEDKLIDDLYIVKATATDRTGRTDEATGAVTIGHLKGDAKANAIMKAETKAKRRVTLSISGLGWTDETEIETIPNAKKVEVNIETGEIIDTNMTQNIPIEQVSDAVKVAENIVQEKKLINKDQIKEYNINYEKCDENFQKYIDAIVSTLKIPDLSQMEEKTWKKFMATYRQYFEEKRLAEEKNKAKL